MQCFALKPWVEEDVEEAQSILRAFTAKEDDKDSK